MKSLKSSVALASVHASAVLLLALALPASSYAALFCNTAIETTVCSAYDLYTQIGEPSTARTSESSNAGPQHAGVVYGDELFQRSGATFASAEARVQTDYGVNKIYVSTSDNARDAFAGAMSLWTDWLNVDGLQPGDTYTVNGHIHGVFGTPRSDTPDAIEYFEYSINPLFQTGMVSNNGFIDRFERGPADVGILEWVINYSLTFEMLGTSGRAFLQSLFTARVADNRTIDAFSTVSIDSIIGPQTMRAWTDSGSLQGENGFFRFAAAIPSSSVPEPHTLFLLLAAFAALGSHFGLRRLSG